VELHLAGALQLGRDGFSGEAAMRADLDALVAGVPASGSVRLHGIVTGDAKEALLRDADVFVLPTYYVNEGQPIAVIEALAYGLPVVATAYRAIPELLPASHAALTVPPRSPERIAETIAAVANDGATYERLSADAVARAHAFDPAAHVAAIGAVLASAVRPCTRSRAQAADDQTPAPGTRP
jgi:glycosyltransferase involved in cell wall biosynthesis